MPIFDSCNMKAGQKCAFLTYIFNMSSYIIALLPLQAELETRTVLKKVAVAHKALAELKGVISSLPNENIILEMLTLQEAKDSSAIENIITTFDEVYQSDVIQTAFITPAAKEVHQYATALRQGFGLVKQHGLLTSNYILKIQEVIEENKAGFRKMPGTRLLNDKTGEVVYTPPQDYAIIASLMNNLETYINDDAICDVDPLIKMAVIHHQFESIHPFYDGNGRTGRIINILYLVQKGLLHLPVLYLSRFIIRNKELYYQLLQDVRDHQKWEPWILFMLEGVELTAKEGVLLVGNIRDLMLRYKQRIRDEHPKIYSQDLLNNLFKYPYTKIDFIQRDLGVSRSTAIRYLEQLVDDKILDKIKVGRDNFYLNTVLFKLLTQ